MKDAKIAQMLAKDLVTTNALIAVKAFAAAVVKTNVLSIAVPIANHIVTILVREHVKTPVLRVVKAHAKAIVQPLVMGIVLIHRIKT